MSNLTFHLNENNPQTVSSLRQMHAAMHRLATEAQQADTDFEHLFATLERGHTSGKVMAQALSRDLSLVRQELEALEESLRESFGSSAQLDSFMTAFKHAAALSAHRVTDLAPAVHTLLDFGLAAHLIPPLLSAISRHSGQSARDLHALSLSVAAVCREGSLLSAELTRMRASGLDPLPLLARQSGQSIAALQAQLDSGAISWQQLHDALLSGAEAMAGHQSSAHRLSEQMALLRTAMTDCFLQGTDSAQDFADRALGTATTLAEGYQRVADVLATLSDLYGTYTAVLSLEATGADLAQATSLQAEAEVLDSLISAHTRENLSRQGLTAGTQAYNDAIRQELLNHQAVAIERARHIQGALQQAQQWHSATSQALSASQQKLSAAHREWQAAQASGEAQRIATAQTALATATDEHHTAAKRHKAAATHLTTQKAAHETATLALNTATTNVNTAAAAGGVAAKTLAAKAAHVLTVAQAKLNAVIMANPYAMATVAVGALAYGLYKLATRASVAEMAQEKLNSRLKEQKQRQEELRSEQHGLLSVIRDENETMMAKAKAYDALKQHSKALTEAYTLEQLSVLDKAEAEKVLNAERDKHALEAARHALRQAEDKANNSLPQRYDKAPLHPMMAAPSAMGAPLMPGSGLSHYVSREAQAELEAARLHLSDVERHYKEAQRLAALPPLKVRLAQAELDHGQALQAFAAAKATLELWRQKAAANAFVSIPFHVQLTYNRAQASLLQADRQLSFLQQQQAAGRAEKEMQEQQKAEERRQKAEERRRRQIQQARQSERNTERRMQHDRETLHLDKTRGFDRLQWDIDRTADQGRKEEKQHQLDLEKALYEVERERQDRLQKLIDEAKQRFEQQTPDSTRSFYATKAYRSVKLSAQDKAYFDDKRAAVEQDFLNKKAEQMQALFDKYKTHEERITDIKQSYARERAAIDSDKLKSAEEKQRALVQLGKAETEALKTVHDEALEALKKDNSLIASFFDSTAERSIGQIRRLIAQMTLLKRYLEAPKDAEGKATIRQGRQDIGVTKGDIMAQFGLSAQDLTSMQQSPTLISNLGAAIANFDKGLPQSPFQSFIEGFDKGVASLKSGDFEGGLSDINQAFTAFAPHAKTFANDLGTIFGSSDFGNKAGHVVDGIMGVGEAAMGVGRIMSGDVVGGTMAVVGGVAKVVKAFDGLFGANYEKYERAKKAYEDYTQVLDKVVDRQKAMISSLDAQNAMKSYTHAMSLIGRSEEAARKLGKERLNAGTSAGSRSIGVRLRRHLRGEAMDEAVAALRQSGLNASTILNGRLTALFDLSAKQLETLQTNAPLFWSKLDADVRRYLEDIIKCGEKSEALQKNLTENLTQVSFDSLYGSFLSTLSDMDKGAEDFGVSFGQYMKKAILNAMLKEHFEKRLEGWHKSFAHANADGHLSADEISRLRRDWDSMAQQALQRRDMLQKTLGDDIISPEQRSQTATSRSVAAVSQETAQELNGRFTAMQLAMEETKQAVLTMLGFFDGLSVSFTGATGILTEMKDLMILSNGHLEDIARHTKLIKNCHLQLETIAENIRNL